MASVARLTSTTADDPGRRRTVVEPSPLVARGPGRRRRARCARRGGRRPSRAGPAAGRPRTPSSTQGSGMPSTCDLGEPGARRNSSGSAADQPRRAAPGRPAASRELGAQQRGQVDPAQPRRLRSSISGSPRPPGAPGRRGRGAGDAGPGGAVTASAAGLAHDPPPGGAQSSSRSSRVWRRLTWLGAACRAAWPTTTEQRPASMRTSRTWAERDQQRAVDAHEAGRRPTPPPAWRAAPGSGGCPRGCAAGRSRPGPRRR